MTNIEFNSLVELFDEVYEYEQAIDSYRIKIKSDKKEISNMIKVFAENHEVSPKDVKKAYDYWCENQENDSNTNDDFFTLCSIIDSGLSSEE